MPASSKLSLIEIGIPASAGSGLLSGARRRCDPPSRSAASRCTREKGTRALAVWIFDGRERPFDQFAARDFAADHPAREFLERHGGSHEVELGERNRRRNREATDRAGREADELAALAFHRGILGVNGHMAAYTINRELEQTDSLSDRHSRRGLGCTRACAVALTTTEGPKFPRRGREPHRAPGHPLRVEEYGRLDYPPDHYPSARAAQSRAAPTIGHGCSSRAACTATRRAACTARCNSSSNARRTIQSQSPRGALRESLGLRARSTLERECHRSESLVQGRQCRWRIGGAAAPGCAAARTLPAPRRPPRDDRFRRERIPPRARRARRQAIRARPHPGWVLSGRRP